MKVVHICLGCFYIDNYSYQENMIPKFHKKMGYEVEIIASTLSFNRSGESCYVDAGVYTNEYGIKVTRLPYTKKLPSKVGVFFRIYDGVYEALCASAPDILFIHGCQFWDIKCIVKYAKSHKVKIFVDNHADFSNSATNWLSKNILHKMVWRHCAHEVMPYTEKFYGVLPARVDFLKDIYKLPAEKCELLVMGADDDLVERATNPAVRTSIREKYNIQEDDFLIVTGGKIDRWKMQTLLLMDAVKNIQNPHVKLIVFGSVTQDLKDRVLSHVDGEKVQYIGWIQSSDSYKYFAAADLVCFPGRHSVFWEQVAGQGIPMLVKDWPGTHHVDLGGNVLFLTEGTVDEIKSIIQKLLSNPKEYEQMWKASKEKAAKVFSYANIAKCAIKTK